MNTAIYLINALILVTAGVILANIVLESNVMRRLSPFVMPFCRTANLPKECVFSLFTSFFNPTAGKSTLAGFYREGKIGDKDYERLVFYAPIELEAVMRKNWVKCGEWYEIFYLGVRKVNTTFTPQYKINELGANQ